MPIYGVLGDLVLQDAWVSVVVDPSWAVLRRRGLSQGRARQEREGSPGFVLRRAACGALGKPVGERIVVWLERANPQVDAALTEVLHAAMGSKALSPELAAQIHLAPDVYVAFADGSLTLAPEVREVPLQVQDTSFSC